MNPIDNVYGALENIKKTLKITKFKAKVNNVVKFEAIIIINFGKLIFEISDALNCIEVMPFNVLSEK